MIRRYLLTPAVPLDRIDVFLGSRVAQGIVFGDVPSAQRRDRQRMGSHPTNVA